MHAGPTSIVSSDIITLEY